MRFHESVPVDECNDHFNALSGGDFFASGFIGTLFYHFNTHAYHVCAVGVVGGVGWGGQRVYGETDYYYDEIKKGGKKI